MNATSSAFENLYPPAEGPSLPERLSALRRRLRPMLITLGTVTLVTLLAAALWPPRYTSSGTVLIEQQEVPEEFVQAAVTSFADQRVRMISQRVMTTSNLLRIIERYDLYPERRAREPREKLLERMRSHVGLEMISADVVDPRQGRATKATIAFTVSYENRSPVLAARVANELTTLFLNENLENRKRLAADASAFLRDEAARVGAELAELDRRLADFKGEHADALPEFADVNLQLLTRADEELRSVEARVESLDQQLVYLDAQLAQIEPSIALLDSTGQRVLAPADRLELLRTELASRSAVVGAEHPDVVRLRREIAALGQQVESDEAGTELVRGLAEAKAQLEQARNRYSTDHPDVVRLEKVVAAIETAMRSSGSTAASMRVAENPDNPAYIQVRAQREAALAERGALARRLGQLQQRTVDLEARIADAPSVEREYSQLLRDLQGAQLKYQEVRQKQMAAQVSENLESEQKGERFTLIEPPLVPQRPSSPNRPLILVLGMLLAFGAAFAVGAFLEATDDSIRGRRDLAQLLAAAPLAVVPLVELDEERAARARLRRYVAIALAVAVPIAAAVVHWLYRPLDVIWHVLLRRLGF